jgi:zinc transporter ZupT
MALFPVISMEPRLLAAFAQAVFCGVLLFVAVNNMLPPSESTDFAVDHVKLAEATDRVTWNWATSSDDPPVNVCCEVPV